MFAWRLAWAGNDVVNDEVRVSFGSHSFACSVVNAVGSAIVGGTISRRPPAGFGSSSISRARRRSLLLQRTNGYAVRFRPVRLQARCRARRSWGERGRRS